MLQTDDPDSDMPSPAKEAWEKPTLARIAAGDAEFGATPLVPEGAFAFGS